MSKVAIIGNGGGGKSTLAIKLGKALRIDVHHIDRIQFKPGWKLTPPEEVARTHGAILAADRWIIDGWGGWQLMERRFASADTIILIDLPLHIHYWWAFKRQITSAFRSTADRPDNCPLLPKTWEMMRVLWMVHHQIRPQLFDLIERYRAGRDVITLTSPQSLRQFSRSYCVAE